MDKIVKIQKIFLRRQLGVKSSTSYPTMLLEIGTQTIQVLIITKVNNMAHHRLPRQAWNIGCKVQKPNKDNIPSSGWVLDIMKTFKRWGVKDLLELSGDAMKYVTIEDIH